MVDAASPVERGRQKQYVTMLEQLEVVRRDMVELAAAHRERLQSLHPIHGGSAENLLHYLALRRHELRPLQEQLARAGLSSLGRAEAHVLASLDAVLALLRRLAGVSAAPLQPALPEPAAAWLHRHAENLLGPPPPQRGVRIMVTMPGEAAQDYTLIHELVQAGMDCMRINCAHDEQEDWKRMIGHLRKAEQAVNRSCRVFMDLAGPKLRTGPVALTAGVIKFRPTRNSFGQVTAPARVWLTDRSAPQPAPTAADAVLPLPAGCLERIEIGDRLEFRDARGAKREMYVVDRSTPGCWAEAFQTAYLRAETTLKFRRQGRKSQPAVCLGPLPEREQDLLLRIGDTLVLTRGLAPGRPAVGDSQGRLLSPAQIGCTLPEIFDDVQPGERVWLDDGKIGGVIRSVDDQQLRIRITHARPQGDRLKGDKGINLPDSNLRLSALTDKDRADLPFIVKHADVVGYSFVRKPEHVEELEAELARLGGQEVGICLKIETRQAFDNLPSLLLAAMRSPRAGVMIARGDLAVECGYERLAEVQEEILWMCEAAHLPVIWATQVLENLAKQGIPSRAEISDAASAGRAECVMLNKGPHIVKAVQVLDDILRRMQAHQNKKRSMLRPLQVARGFDQEERHGVDTPCPR